ncbi:uncharacterized protein LOC112271018 [Brachypodium distachyon]|uniref:uncharacterized protein LOC112271018 n=1 Tax=Brachypodium distachyon TaxID=15368 RepID=UPI0001C73102|nr:uncharacterized protein LOC112271018 [Brachypodium distachyon]|eukprot:XP_024315665.1 uncharacterized protein LOC112271018 [Brachypodium distachyon]
MRAPPLASPRYGCDASGGPKSRASSRPPPPAWRHGLLLVRLALHGAGRLAVCELLTGACHVLPPLLNDAEQFEEQTRDGYAILSAAECRSTSSSASFFFKVLVVTLCSPAGQDDAHMVCLHTLSSSAGSGGEAGCWSAPRVESFDCEDGWCNYGPICGGNYGPICHGDAVVLRGAAHWLFSDRYGSRFHAIQVDVETGCLSTTKFPHFPLSDVLSTPCLGVVADGTLSFLKVQRSPGSRPRLQIRERQGGDPDDSDERAADEAAPKRWLCAKTVELKPPEGKKKQEAHSRLLNMYFMLGEKCGKLLVTDIRINRVYAADLGTGTTEEVVAWPQGRTFNRNEAVPLEMDWPAMFASRLGDRAP